MMASQDEVLQDGNLEQVSLKVVHSLATSNTGGPSRECQAIGYTHIYLG